MLANIINKPEKHFEESLAQLIEAMEKIFLSSEAKDIVLKQLAFENATPTFHSLLKTTKISGNVEVVTSYFQDMPRLLQPHKARTLSQILIKDRKYLINQARLKKVI